MKDGQIVAMIDACLERLQTARQLLSSAYDTSAIEALLKTSKEQIAKTKKKVRPAIAIKKTRRDELTPSLFEQPLPAKTAPLLSAQVEPVLLQPIVEIPVAPVAIVATPISPTPIIAAAPRREPEPRLPPTPRKKHVPLSSALVSHVPAGPVFISAAQVKETMQRKAEAKVEKAAAEQDSVPFTAEMLAKRWLKEARF